MSNEGLVQAFGVGDEPRAIAPGDFLLTHRPGLVPALISIAEKRRFGAEGHWSHAALVVDGRGLLIEAERQGVITSPLARYRDAQYVLIRTSRLISAEGATRAVAYAQAQVGKAFGYLVLASLGIWLLLGPRVEFQRQDHQICSSLVARALSDGGLNVGPDPTFMLPADLANRFNAPTRPENSR